MSQVTCGECERRASCIEKSFITSCAWCGACCFYLFIVLCLQFLCFVFLIFVLFCFDFYLYTVPFVGSCAVVNVR